MAKYNKKRLGIFNEMIRAFELSKTTLYKRIIEHGWSIEKACLTPRYLYYNGKSCTIECWAKSLKIPVNVLYARLKQDGDIEKALNTPVDQRELKVLTKVSSKFPSIMP